MNRKQKKNYRPRKSSDDLKIIAENQLKYVIWMLNETATLSAKPNSPENNAYIESFVIHARMLIEFLYGESNRNDDIRAADYVDSWRDDHIGDNKPFSKSTFIKDIKTKADKMAAHLTDHGSMYSDKDREWDRIKIRDEINKIILEFLDAVPDDATISKETKSEIRSIIMKESGPNGVPYDSIKTAEIITTGLTSITGATGPHQ